MTAVKFSPVGNGVNWIPNTGLIANGYKLYFYEAGTTTKLDTYTTSAGSVANANPIVLDTYGFPASGGNRVQIWLQEGESYKVVIASDSDTDPPASGITLADGITGVNDIRDLVSEWLLYSADPTYVSSTSFTVVGNQTALFHVGRRIKSTVSGGTAYSTITATSYSAPDTTVTVVNDSTALDAGLSVVYYGLLSGSGSGPSIPKFAAPDGSTATTQTGGDNSTKLATTAYSDSYANIYKQDFRLTLTSGVPVLTSNVGLSTTIYLCPYIGNKISLYNGSVWKTLTSAQVSLALGVLTASVCYDVFAYDNSGTVTLEKLAWTSSVTRATALAYQDGILVKSGDATRRYIGTFYAETTSATTMYFTQDSTTNSYGASLWNYYNRVKIGLKNPLDSSATSGYTNTTWVRLDAPGLTNYIRYVVGVSEDAIAVSMNLGSSNSVASVNRGIGIGYDSVSVPYHSTSFGSVDANDVFTHSLIHTRFPTTGLGFLVPLVYSQASGTTTWQQNSDPYFSLMTASYNG